MTLKPLQLLASVLAFGLVIGGLAAAENPRPAQTPARPAPSPEAAKPTASPEAQTKEPDRVVVQHILVSFSGKLPGKTISRTQEEARALAGQILERARKGEEFDALVKQYTDDQAPGVYKMFNRGRTAADRDEYARQGMVPCFGDMSFRLAPGEIGVCEYDQQRSPYGWHIIKRIK